MASQEQLYHCDRCGTVFRSEIRPVAELRCSGCGKSPVRDGFSDLTAMPELDPEMIDANRGIAGRDEADFFSVQRRKKQQRAIVVYASWFILLATMLGLGYMVKKKRDQREKERELINKEYIEYDKRLAQGLRACLIRFNQFASSEDENERALHIFNGRDYLVAIRDYYRDPINKEPYKDQKITVLKANLVEDKGKLSRLDVLLEIERKGSYNQRFEAVFWQKDDQWYLDWPQFIRLGEVDWPEFVKRPAALGEFEFRLYVRKRGIEIKQERAYRELVFSKSNNIDDDVSSDQTAVLVKQHSQLETEILKHMERTGKRKFGRRDVLGVIDTTGQSRARVGVAFEEIDGQRVLVLKKFYAGDWFSKGTDAPKQSTKMEPTTPKPE